MKTTVKSVSRELRHVRAELRRVKKGGPVKAVRMVRLAGLVIAHKSKKVGRQIRLSVYRGIMAAIDFDERATTAVYRRVKRVEYRAKAFIAEVQSERQREARRALLAALIGQ